MLTSPANKKGAQGPQRKAAPGKRKGKAEQPRHTNRAASLGCSPPNRDASGQAREHPGNISERLRADSDDRAWLDW
jgi:hypothetical protein